MERRTAAAATTTTNDKGRERNEAKESDRPAKNPRRKRERGGMEWWSGGEGRERQAPAERATGNKPWRPWRRTTQDEHTCVTRRGPELLSGDLQHALAKQINQALKYQFTGPNVTIYRLYFVKRNCTFQRHDSHMQQP